MPRKKRGTFNPKKEVSVMAWIENNSHEALFVWQVGGLGLRTFPAEGMISVQRIKPNAGSSLPIKYVSAQIELEKMSRYNRQHDRSHAGHAKRYHAYPSPSFVHVDR